MFALTANVAEASGYFTHAATLLNGRDPRDIIRDGDPDTLYVNRTGQILCTLQALAATAALRDVLPARRIVAGYSVGELAAWAIAGWMDDTALDLASRRASAMDAASGADDGLLFVRGLPRRRVEDLCRKQGIAIAIVNPGEAFVIGGPKAALDAFAGAALEAGAARPSKINVQVASHTSRLAAASVEFLSALTYAPIRRPALSPTRLLSGIDGSVVRDVAPGLDNLARQISQRVEWAACLQSCIEGGAGVFLELGPGRALAEMAASTYAHIPARSIEDFRTLEGVRAWLGSLSH